MLQYDREHNQIVWSTRRDTLRGMMFSGTTNAINLADVTKISRGLSTQVFLKAKQLDPLQCLSIITRDRTLDVVFASNQERDMAFKALQILFENDRLVLFL